MTKGITFSRKGDAQEYLDKLLNEGYEEAMMVPVAGGKWRVIKEPSTKMKQAEFEELPGMAMKQQEEQEEEATEETENKGRRVIGRLGQGIREFGEPEASATSEGTSSSLLKLGEAIKTRHSRSGNTQRERRIKALPAAEKLTDLNADDTARFVVAPKGKTVRIKAKPSVGKLRV